MDKSYWNSMAGRYEDEIFSSLHSDANGLIAKTITKNASKKMTACDFGCGIGHYIPLLSSKFKHVYAYDLSPQLVEQARQKNAELKNVDYGSQDFFKAAPAIGPVDFGICANVLIAESYELRKGILTNIRTCLKKKGENPFCFALP